MTLNQVLEQFAKASKEKNQKDYSDKLWHEVPAVIAGKRTGKLILCYQPILFNGKDLYYPLYTPLSVLCLEMKTIGE